MKRVALVGTPNSGKTTLFNWMTGSRQKVVNYPGSTVDYTIGRTMPLYGDVFEVVDTPGTYSLFPKSPDEEVTCRALFDDKLHLTAVIVVVDGCQIARQLHLVEQLKQIGYTVIVAMTMADLISQEGSVNFKKLSVLIGAPVYPIDGTLGGGVKELIRATRELEHKIWAPVPLAHWDSEKRRTIYGQMESIAAQVEVKTAKIAEKTARLDRYFLHPVFGFALFALIMTALFTSIYSLATPFMDLIDSSFGAAVEFVRAHSPSPLLADFLGDGLLAGIGAVVIFVPQIFILFVGISFLEDSGYLARAAALVDKPLSKLGLNGKSFVPLLSGFACAIPGMMATRAINSRKAKWITMFILPFMTCSARLPVYALLLGFLFRGEPAWKPGLALAALYLSGIIVAGISAGVLNLFIKMPEKSFFLLELPIYRRPQFSVIVRNSLKRTKAYLFRSGPIIFGFAVLIWAASTFPNYQLEGHERMSSSYAAKAGQFLEPVVRPMGADWRVGVGLLSAFAAREVFVSSLAVIMNVTATDDSDEGMQDSLLTSMSEAKTASGLKLFTVPSVLALLFFFVIALQCTTTTSVAFREMKSARFAAFQLVFMNVLAYVVAVVIFQVTTAAGL